MGPPARPGDGSADADVAAHYDDPVRAEGLAGLYEARTPLGEFYRDRVRRIAGLIEDVDGTLLDAGCGTGQMLRFLQTSRPRDLSLTGLDRSQPVLEVARSMLADDPAVRLVNGRLEAMPLPDGSFDVVLAMGSLEYAADLALALGEIARVTRPGGRALVTMQHRLSPYRLWEDRVWSRVRRRRRGGVASPIRHRCGPRQLRRLLTAAGLNPVSVVDYSFRLLPAPVDDYLPRLATTLQRRLARIGRGPVRVLATDYIVVARRRGDRR